MKYWPAAYFFRTLLKGKIARPPNKAVKSFNIIVQRTVQTVTKLCEESSLDASHRLAKKSLICIQAENNGMHTF